VTRENGVMMVSVISLRREIAFSLSNKGSMRWARRVARMG